MGNCHTLLSGTQIQQSLNSSDLLRSPQRFVFQTNTKFCDEMNRSKIKVKERFHRHAFIMHYFMRHNTNLMYGFIKLPKKRLEVKRVNFMNTNESHLE